MINSYKVCQGTLVGGWFRKARIPQFFAMDIHGHTNLAALMGINKKQWDS